jgi:hypothetical protein
MRLFHLATALAILVSGAAGIGAQEEADKSVEKEKAVESDVSPGQAAINKAASGQKYIFILFWKDRDPKTIAAQAVVEATVAKVANLAESVMIQTTEPTELPIVEKFKVGRSPMPLVIAVSPCGAITKYFTGAVNEKELRTAFVSPGMQRCLKALQSDKLVLLCVMDPPPAAIPKGVADFKADENFGPATEVLKIHANDKNEASFLRDFNIDPKMKKPVVVFIGPPGKVICHFNGTVTKEQIIAKLAAIKAKLNAGRQGGPAGGEPKK